MITTNLVRELQRYGIKAENYKRPPLTDSVYAMSIAPRGKTGTILINQGLAEVDLYGSRKHKQAAITVVEKGRKITRKCRHQFFQDKEPSRDQIIYGLKESFPIPVPGGSVWNVTDIHTTWKARQIKPYGDTQRHWLATGIVTATIGETTTTHFLMGMDETHNFIAVLPDKPRSVRHAHSMLRAPGAKKDTIRQGEWFFIKCDVVTNKILDNLMKNNPGSVRPFRLGKRYRGLRVDVLSSSDSGSTHVAKSGIVRSGRLYVRGLITDDRKAHHEVLSLDQWHRVAKNKEGEIKVDSFQRAMMERRRRTWD